MNKSVVRCRCGHQILAKEVLRTDLYERSSGRDYVYVKFRCARCKRLGQIFIAENRWDWSVLEATRSDLNEAERDRFLDESPISSLECINFRRQMADIFSLDQLQSLVAPVAGKTETGTADEIVASDGPAGHESDAKEREMKEHRGLRNLGERTNPERNASERGEDKNARKKPESNLPGTSSGDCADDTPSKA